MTVDPKPRPRLTHRTDIDGLRGLAIALVVVFHVFIGRVSSGVDVFLLVGGVFFFAPQFRNALNPKGMTLPQSVWRILRRLFPALITVVFVSALLALLFLPASRWVQTGQDASAALLYFENLHLANQGQEYASIGRDVSLFQHIWSMSVQMQIYVGALVAIVLLAVFFRKRARTGTWLLRSLLVVATVASFAYATWLGGENQALNYYSPLSRFWEIGLGGLFGLWLIGWVIPRSLAWIRWPAGLVGLVLIIATGMFLDGAAQFPGPWTLVPLAGAMLVILAGNPVAERGGTGRSIGVARLLDSRPFQFLGRISYSLYLWHWPLLTLATYYFAAQTTGTSESSGSSSSTTGGTATGDVSPSGGLKGITATLGTGEGVLVGSGVILASLVLAWLTYRLVETPTRQKAKPERSWGIFDRRRRAAAAAPSDTPDGSDGDDDTSGDAEASGTDGTDDTDGANRRDAAPRRTLRPVPVATVLLMAAATGGVLALAPLAESHNVREAEEAMDTEVTEETHPGPAAYLQDVPVTGNAPVLPPAVWDDDTMYPQTTIDGCITGVKGTDLLLTHEGNASDVPCVYGDTNAERTMYLAGGSHSEQFLPALDTIGRERGIKIIPILKMGCPLGMQIPKFNGDPYPECYEWQEKAEQYIFDNPPTDGVFLSSTRPMTRSGEGPDHVPEGYVDVVRRFSDAGIHTFAARDNPWHNVDGTLGNSMVCVADGGDAEECGMQQDEALAEHNPALTAYEGLDVTHIDLTAAYCRDGTCPAIVGNVLVYRDGNHFTPMWAEMMSGEIERQMYDPQALADNEAAAQEAKDAGASAQEEAAGKLAPPQVQRMPKPWDPDYVPPAEDPADPPAEQAPEQEPVDPGYVDPGYVDPGYVDPGYVDPGYVAPAW